jgi:hypothetical protein
LDDEGLAGRNYLVLSRFSLKAEGNKRGMNFTRIGSNKLPPGTKNMVSEGIVLQISSNWFFTFLFSS